MCISGGDTGRRYRILRGCQLNVEELDPGGRRKRLLCFLPEGRVPVGDIMLAQKIALELFSRSAQGCSPCSSSRRYLCGRCVYRREIPPLLDGMSTFEFRLKREHDLIGDGTRRRRDASDDRIFIRAGLLKRFELAVQQGFAA